MCRDDAAVRRSRHRWQHCGEPSIASEYLDHQEAFVRAGGGPQAIGHLDRTGNTSAKPDAVIGPWNIVVHGFGNSDGAHAFLVQAYRVAERIVAPDWNQEVDAEPIEIFQHFWSQVVFLGAVRFLQMRGNRGLLYLTGVGARTVQEGPTGAAGPVDDFLRQYSIV